jgi:O-antigen ligase
MDQTLEAAPDRRSFFKKIYALLRFPYREDSLFSVIFFASLFIPLTQTSGLADGFETPKLVLWMIVTAFALFIAVKRRASVRSLPVAPTATLAVFMVLALLSTIITVDLLNSIFGLYTRFTSSLLVYGLWACWIVVVYKTLDVGKAEFLLKTLNLSGLLIAVFGLLQQQDIAFYAGVAGGTRSVAPSFLGNPNFSSMYLVAIVPVALYCFYQSRQKIGKYYYASSAFLMIWAIMAFTSRGAILGVAVSLLVFSALFLFKNRNWYSFLTLGILGVVTALLFVGFFTANRPGTVSQTIALTDQTTSFRLLAWGNTAKIIADSPWFGTGHGNYYIGFKALGDNALSSGERFDDAHNLYLHVASTGGIPFALSFVFLLAASIAAGLWVYSKTDQSTLAAALVSGLLGWMVVVSFNPVTIACWLVAATIIGLLWYLRYSSGDYAATSVNFGKVVTGLMVVSGALFLLYAVTFLTSEILTYQGIKYYRYHNYARAEKLLQWGVYTNPNNTAGLTYWAGALIKQQKSPEEADKVITFMTQLHPRSSGIWQSADTLYFMLYKQTNDNRYREKMVYTLEEFLKHDPNFAFTLGHQAYLYFKIDEKQKARQFSYYTLTRSYDQYYTWLLLAELYKESGMRDQMLFAMKRAITVQPDIKLFKIFYEQAAATTTLEGLTIPIMFVDPDLP